MTTQPPTHSAMIPGEKPYTDYFTYDHSTGFLYWRERPLELFADRQRGKVWNARFAGKIAGNKKRLNGMPHKVELRDPVTGKKTGAHRIIWHMLFDPIPPGMDVDHKDRNPWDNRPSNLRLATSSQNNMNKRRIRNGLKGVCFHKGRYCASLDLNGERISLGSFSTEAEAHEAYKQGAVRHYGEFARFE